MRHHKSSVRFQLNDFTSCEKCQHNETFCYALREGGRNIVEEELRGSTLSQVKSLSGLLIDSRGRSASADSEFFPPVVLNTYKLMWKSDIATEMGVK